MTDPRRFFADMPITGGLAAPSLFGLAVVGVAAAGAVVFAGAGVSGFFSTLALGVLKIVLGAALLTVIARQLFEGRGDFEATFRGCAYAAAPAALLWVPLVGPVAAIYTIYLLVLALQRAQGFDSVKAVCTLMLAALVSVTLLLRLGWPWTQSPTLIRL
jgi:hypothetical protein